MLGNNFLKVNGVKIPNPASEKMTNKPNRTVGVSEASTDIIINKRSIKRTWTWTFQVTEKWRSKLEDYSRAPTANVTRGSETITGQWIYSEASLVKGSEYTPGTDGLYIVKITFIEK